MLVGWLSPPTAILIPVAGVIAACLPNPGNLVLLLCGGFLIADRSFAFLKGDVPGIGVPLYITEVTLITVLLALILKAAVAGRLRIWDQSDLSVPLVLFFVPAAMHFFWELWLAASGEASLLLTLKNFALVYYAGFYVLAVLGIQKMTGYYKIARVFHWLCFVMAARYLLSRLGLLSALRFGEPFGDSNFLCIVLPVSVAILFAFLPRRQRDVSHYALIVVAISAVLLTEIRQGYLGLVAALTTVVYLLRRYRFITRRRSQLAAVAGLFSLCVLFYAGYTALTDESAAFGRRLAAKHLTASGRGAIWGEYLSDFADSGYRVAFGAGFQRQVLPDFTKGNIEKIRSSVTGEPVLDPHNSHLHVLYRTGVVGFVGYLWLGIVGVRRCLQAIERCMGQASREELLMGIGLVGAFASVAAEATVGVLLEAPYRGIWYWLLLGACTSYGYALQRQYSVMPNSKRVR